MAFSDLSWEAPTGEKVSVSDECPPPEAVGLHVENQVLSVPKITTNSRPTIESMKKNP